MGLAAPEAQGGSRLHVIHAGDESYGADAFRWIRTLPAHRHDDVHLVIYSSGANALRLDDAHVRWRAPWGLLIDGGRHHEVRPHEPGAIRYLQITLRVLAADGRAIPADWPSLISAWAGRAVTAADLARLNPAQWRACMAPLRSAIDAVRTGDSCLCGSHLLTVVHGLLEGSAAADVPGPLARLEAALAADPAAAWSVGRMAAVAGWSAGHLHRACRVHRRMRPMDLVFIARLELAAQLLRSSDAPLATVAAECGFADAYHFSRRFKDRFGEPPGRWRRRQADM